MLFKKHGYRFIALAVGIVVGLSGGIAINKRASAKYDDVLKSNWQNYDGAEVALDKKTGVEYLVVSSNDERGLSITPRLNANGKPIVKK